jgi:hypothetical protein
MSVTVECHFNGRMAQLLLDVLRIFTLGDQQ